MNIKLWINGKMVQEDVAPDMNLYNYLRSKGYKSVKCGCDTSNCGLCTVWVEDKAVLSCSTLTVRMDGKKVVTLEGMQEEAEAFGMFLAEEGAEQCGFCSPGLIMNVLRMKRELESPTEEMMRHYLAGNLCRCTGYMGQLRAIKKYLDIKEEA
ncbi:MAG: 2Fe-2S iron-sulfur cluster-binding protein [Niameybacter sp.]|uniref:(2Fe-2S)-binding protein n=1 Tax=Niameybacter sp. TaxID=2033640 RepID=UPI002FCB19C0